MSMRSSSLPDLDKHFGEHNLDLIHNLMHLWIEDRLLGERRELSRGMRDVLSECLDLIDKLNLIMIVVRSTISLRPVTPVAPGGQIINHTSTP